MTVRIGVFGIVVASGFMAGCPTSTNNGGGNGVTVAAVPKGTDCSANVIACYDEFAHQPVNVICFREASRWASTELTWRLSDPLPGLDREAQEEIAARAFALWSDASGLSFSSGGADVDISISFGAGDHGDPFPFDGRGNNLGHAFFPGSGDPGSIHLCSAEDWGLTSGSGRFDLFTAMVHEIGHALGVEHSLDAGAVMAPSYGGPISELTEDDVEAIQRLYGSSDGDVPPIIDRGQDFDDFCAAAIADLTALGDPDTDGDGIPDTVEFFVLNTEPLAGDSDGDNVADFVEVFVDATDPISITDFNPASVVIPPLPTTDGNNRLDVRLFVDGVLADSYALGDDSIVGLTPPGGFGGDVFSIVMQRGFLDPSDVSQIGMTFSDAGDLNGTAIALADINGFMQLAASSPEVAAAQFCRNVDLFGNDTACPDNISGTPSGTISLALSGGRLFGSFDFSITNPASFGFGGMTFRAVGDIDVPDNFSQAPDLGDLGDLFGGFPGFGG